MACSANVAAAGVLLGEFGKSVSLTRLRRPALLDSLRMRRYNVASIFPEWFRDTSDIRELGSYVAVLVLGTELTEHCDFFEVTRCKFQ